MLKPSRVRSPKKVVAPVEITEDMDATPAAGAGSGDINDYLAEIQDIRENRDPEEAPEEELKTPDEGEQEVAWLKDTGFGHLASKYEEGHELDEEIVLDETSSLTKAQAAAVKKRIDTLNATIRKRVKQPHKGDVRDLFAGGATGGRHHSDSSAPSSGKAVARGRESSFLRNKGGYSVTGGAKAHDTHSIETLSLQATEQHSKRHALSESDMNVGVAFRAADGTPPTARAAHTHSGKVRPSTMSKHGLQNFLLKRDDPLGLTMIEDLSKQDMSRIRALALIELTALFDIHNIVYTRRKAKRRLFKEHGIYGVPLQSLLEQGQKKHRHLGVPLFYKQLMECLMRSGIEEEGILRVPGSATRIKCLRQEIEDKFSSDKFKWDDVRPNDAAGLLKQFLRDLPIPLLTFEYLEAFAKVEKIPNQMERVQALNFLVLLLPDVHRNTLKILLEFLLKIVEHTDNRMTMMNVAMIMAPNLFLVQSGRSKPKGVNDLEFAMAAGTSNIVRMMIQYQEIMWTVPPIMMTQIRQQYDTEVLKKSRDKSIMKLLGRRDKSEAYKKVAIRNEGDFQRGIIRVKSSARSKHSTPIHLEPSTTARDVVAQYQRLAPPVTETNGKESRDSSGDELDSCSSIPEMTLDNTHLYEVGGNIGERQLDNAANMMSLYKVNPNTDWVVKTKPG